MGKPTRNKSARNKKKSATEKALERLKRIYAKAKARARGGRGTPSRKRATAAKKKLEAAKKKLEAARKKTRPRKTQKRRKAAPRKGVGKRRAVVQRSFRESVTAYSARSAELQDRLRLATQEKHRHLRTRPGETVTCVVEMWVDGGFSEKLYAILGEMSQEIFGTYHHWNVLGFVTAKKPKRKRLGSPELQVSEHHLFDSEYVASGLWSTFERAREKFFEELGRIEEESGEGLIVHYVTVTSSSRSWDIAG